MATVRALEEGGDTVDIEDFKRIFDLKYLHYNRKRRPCPIDFHGSVTLMERRVSL